MDLFDTRINSYNLDKEETETCCRNSCIKPACFPISVIALFIFMVVFFPLLNEDMLETPRKYEKTGVCKDQCRFEFVESIPTNLTYESRIWPVQNSTYSSWQLLLSKAEKSIDIAALYWNLRDDSGYPTSWQGNATFNGLIAAAKRGVKIRIAQDLPSARQPQIDSAYLEKNGLATVRSVNFSHLLGSGVLHTKFWIIDERHIYVGSANMDWKSLTEVKELGVQLTDCTCVAHDLGKVFNVYWKMGAPKAELPSRWPLQWRTEFNADHPLLISLNNLDNHRLFLSSSPVKFNPKGRENDSEAIVATIANATEFVHIAVMDYIPATLYMPQQNNYYWGVLDDALRSAAYRGVKVKLLMSQWNHTRPQIFPFLRSLEAINDGLPVINRNGSKIKGRIDVKIFQVPSTAAQAQIPFARVNHNKYMVTDNTAYIGTSNWAGDYFINTAGVGFVLRPPDNQGGSKIITRLGDIFLRDWGSRYARPLDARS
uniref:PLD phosphodiesterase domain-containing protein n=1 Tax=Plectus sambesii TaxID=2011161 RepID=A0A914XD81_9BILA